MARPRYFICCEGRIVDQSTGLITHYNVIDRLIIPTQKAKPDNASETSAQPAIPLLIRFVAIAVWTREEDERPDTEFDYETRMFVPGEPEPRSVHGGTFHFGDFGNYRLETFIALGVNPARAPADNISRIESGILRLESRVRPTGKEEWVSQEYLIPVKVERTENQADE